MAAMTTAPGTPEQLTNSHVSAKLAKGPGRIGIIGFLIALVIGLAGYGIKMTHKVAGPLFKITTAGRLQRSTPFAGHH